MARLYPMRGVRGEGAASPGGLELGKVSPPGRLLLGTPSRRTHEENSLGRSGAVASDAVSRLRLCQPGSVQVLEFERVGSGVRAVALPGLVPYPDRRPGNCGGGSAPDAAHRPDRRSLDRARDVGCEGNAHLLGPPAAGHGRGGASRALDRRAAWPVAAFRCEALPQPRPRVTGEAAPSVADLVGRARDPRAPIRVRHAAFATLVERFEEMAFATALPWSDGPESARDACQDAFLLAWRRLPTLREPAAFGGWLKRLLRTLCSRARRRRDGWAAIQGKGACDTADARSNTHDTAELVARRELQRLLRRAVAGLPHGEREAVVLFYFLGEPLRAIALVLGVSVGFAGKLVYTARLRLRRALPRSITETFLATAPTPAFVRRVRAGALDEFVGEYWFASRPRGRVIVRREGDVLVSYAGGQRNILASGAADILTATEYDGEARFQRDGRGDICRFVYYEFGRRLGVACKVAARPRDL